jgi:hypothetical protein
VLEVVEQEQETLAGDEFRQHASAAKCPRCGWSDVGRVGQRREGHPPDPVGIRVRNLSSRLKSKPRLSRSAGPTQREQPDVVADEQVPHLSELLLAAEERSGRDREVRAVKRLQRGELLVAELEDPLRRAQVFEPVLAEVAKTVAVDECRGRGRDEHLPAVPGGGHARGAVDVRPDVALLGQQRRAGVEAHSHRQPERLLRLARRREGAGRRGKRHEERVPLRIHLRAAVSLEGLPQDVPMLGERLRVLLRADLVQQPRRALDVGEEKGDGAAGQLGHGPSLRREVPAPKPLARDGASRASARARRARSRR